MDSTPPCGGFKIRSQSKVTATPEIMEGKEDRAPDIHPRHFLVKQNSQDKLKSKLSGNASEAK